MTRRCLPLIAVSMLVALAAGCGGGGGSSGGNSAADFVSRVTTEFSRGQSGRLWNQLLPADQRVTTRARFMACQPNEGWALKSIKVFDTYSDPVAVGGKTVPATAVSVRVTSEDGVTTATMHAVSSQGHWHWVLQPSDRSAYLRGTCPRAG